MATKKLRLKRRPPQWFLKEWNLTEVKVLKAGYTTEVDVEKGIETSAEISDIVALGSTPKNHNLVLSKEGLLDVVFPENNKYEANFPLQWFEEIK